MIDSSTMMSVVRKDKSVASVPKTVVLGYLAHINKKPSLKDNWPLTEYHLSIPKIVQPGSFKHDIDCSCLFCDSHAKEKAKNEILCCSYNIFFDSFEPKNVPSHIFNKYADFVKNRTDVSLEYYLVYFHDKTDFTVQQANKQTDTLDLKDMKNLLNNRVKDKTPSNEDHFNREYFPLLSRPLEMNDTEDNTDAYYAVPPWMRQKINPMASKNSN